MPNHGFSRVVWKVSLPIIFVEATETFDHLIDTLFLARVGITELGAIAIADSVMLLFLMVPLGLVDGIQILTGRRVGQRLPAAVGAIFNQGLLLVLLVSAAATVALKLFSPMVADWFVQSRPVGEAVNAYLQLDAYSIPLFAVTFACSALLMSLGRTGALIPASLIVVTTDVLLNYVFIFGKFGCPALGMRGAALGSIGAEFVTAIFLIVYVHRQFRHGRFGFFRFRHFEYRITRLLGLLSMPIAAQRLLGDVRWFVFFLIIERVGTEALAIANIVFTCYIVFRIPTEGFSETACSMVSRFIGRNRTHRIGELLRSATRGAIIATGPLIVLAFCTPQWLVGTFSPESNLLVQSNASLRVVALARLVAIPADLWYTAVVGTGDTAAALGIELLRSMVMLCLTWFLAIYLAWPMSLVWLAVPIAWLVSLAVSYGWIKSGIWKRLAI
jgi:putative MATE family efflux protein